MKLLITGENGYIASQLYERLTRLSKVEVTKISVRNGVQHLALNSYDVIIHTAAVVHKKETAENVSDYENVNFELTKELALLAKQSGVQHFIFLSTMAVYGNVIGEINTQTEPQPISHYGKSKLKAEQFLQTLDDPSFKVAIIRPPMVYGPNCPGNYALLSKLSKRVPIFPKVTNQRSMLFVGNLVALIEQLIEVRDNGVFHPQDPQYVNTTEIVATIAHIHKKKMYRTSIGASLLKLLIGRSALYQKVFGDLYYAQELSNYKESEYKQYTTEQGIQIAEKGSKE